jgi:hypothetical protein
MNPQAPVETNDRTTHSEPLARSASIDWYAEGQARTVEVNGVRVTVRFIGRKGRRGRIAIEAPAGAVFQSHEFSEVIRPDVRSE